MVEILDIDYEDLIKKINAANPKGYLNIYASLNEFVHHDLDISKMDQVIDMLCDLDQSIKIIRDRFYDFP